MSYLIGKPDDHEAAALRLYDEYGCNSNSDRFHYVKCYGASCVSCRDSETLHRVCPTCGADLELNGPRPYRCKCGTVIYVCARMSGPVITRYMESPIFKAEEDTI